MAGIIRYLKKVQFTPKTPLLKNPCAFIEKNFRCLRKFFDIVVSKRQNIISNEV